VLLGRTCKNGCTDRDAVGVVGSNGPRNRVRLGPAVLRDVAMATNFGTQFGIILALWAITLVV